jgi:hypothetical protein
MRELAVWCLQAAATLSLNAIDALALSLWYGGYYWIAITQDDEIYNHNNKLIM